MRSPIVGLRFGSVRLLFARPNKALGLTGDPLPLLTGRSASAFCFSRANRFWQAQNAARP